MQRLIRLGPDLSDSIRAEGGALNGEERQIMQSDDPQDGFYTALFINTAVGSRPS